jgi:hypothetical protein
MTATFCQTQSQSHVTTYGLSARLSSREVFVWGQRPDVCYCQTVAGPPLWREDGSVVCNCCWPSQEQSFSRPSPSLSKIWYSPTLEDQVPPATGRPTYTQGYWVPFSQPPTASRTTVEVFEPASTRVSLSLYIYIYIYRLGWCLRYITSVRTAQKRSFAVTPLLLCHVFVTAETLLSCRCLATDDFFWLHYSGLHVSCHSILPDPEVISSFILWTSVSGQIKEMSLFFWLTVTHEKLYWWKVELLYWCSTSIQYYRNNFQTFILVYLY